MKIRASILVSLALATWAAGQGTPVQRYYIKARPDATGQTIPHSELLQRVNVAAVDTDERTGIREDIFVPRFNISAVSAVLTTEQVASLNQQLVEVLPDVILRPAGGPPLGGAWPMDEFLAPTGIAHCGQTPPLVYVVDTGIMPGHDEFNYAPTDPVITFLPGISYGDDVSILPPTPLPAYVDAHDHGTRVAACIGGKSTGLLGLLGASARMKSVLIYDSPAGGGGVATFVSKAINGVLACVADHETRKLQPYMRNHASVLVFAHSTTVAGGRFADLDAVLEIAWQSGLHVVLSAGNEGQPAVLVSPAGAAWGYVSGGPPVRFWFGAPPVGVGYWQAEQEFIVAGGYKEAGAGQALWPNSNTNLATAKVIDVFAPASVVPCASTAGAGVYTTGDGTSYSAAFTAAVAAWVAYERPWARPSQVRTAVKNAATLANGWPKLEAPELLPEALTYAEWIEHFYPAALSDPADRDPLADPDDDTVPNMIEFHCGLDPRFHDLALAPQVLVKPDVGSSAVTVRMPVGCHLGSSPQVKWELQSTSDLVTWAPVATTPLTRVLPVEAMGDGELHEATATGPGLPGPKYYRLRFYAALPL